MNEILNITNGSSAVTIMREADLEGDFLPWDDVLHVGPVPAKLSFEALSEVRAEYIITQGWAEADMVDRLFQERLGIMSHIDKYQRSSSKISRTYVKPKTKSSSKYSRTTQPSRSNTYKRTSTDILVQN